MTAWRKAKAFTNEVRTKSQTNIQNTFTPQKSENSLKTTSQSKTEEVKIEETRANTDAIKNIK
jgi:hypothetical protein